MDKSWYESLINNLNDGIILLDLKKRIIFINKTAEEMLCKSAEDIKGKAFNKVFPEERVISSMFKKVVNDNRLISGRNENISLIKDMRLDFTLVPFFMDNKVEGAILSIRRSSEIDFNNIDFNSLILLLSTIAHEIKNPLTGIKASAQLMKSSVKEESKDYLDRIINESDRLNKILGDYMNISKKPVFGIINLHEVIEMTLKLLDIHIKKKNITINKQYDPSLPDARGDEGKLLQVFFNIIKNAVDFVNNDGIITLKTLPSTEYLLKKGKATHWAIVDITDVGAGIKEKDLDKIFTPFYTKKKGGTGLGLSISKKIINEHGGMIKVRSVENKGTTFSIYIPLS